MNQKSLRTLEEQEAIIAEYLTGSIGYRKLGAKHGINFRRIFLWVKKSRGETLKKPKAISSKQPLSKEEAPLLFDVKQLQEELRKANLYNELLNTMIDIAEDQLKIDIRKKSGTKR
jgi:transposase-like protein